MNTEELKMVLEAISNLGENGKEAFLWWIVLKSGTTLLTTLMILAGTLGIIYIVLRGIMRISHRNAALMEIGKAFGVDFWHWADHEVPGHGINDILVAFRSRIK